MAPAHPTLDDILTARRVVERVASRTPLTPSRTFSRLTGAEVSLKAENLQRTGSFKVRGAAYKLSRLGAEQRRRGGMAASAGNHAQGVALAIKEIRPGVRVVGVQAQAAPGAARSFQEGRWMAVAPAPTVADGIAVASPGELPLALMRRYVDDVTTVSEEEITQAMVLLLERAKLLVEGAGAVGIAALLSGRIPCQGQRVVAILSGGNVDLNLLSRTLDYGLAHAGRFVALRVVVMDRPGELSRLLAVLARQGVNILDVSHLRRGVHLPMGQVLVELTAETRDSEHAAQVAAALEEAGYVRRQPTQLTPPASSLSFVEKEAMQEKG